MSDLDAQITERAIRVVRQLAHVAVERAELARELGYETDAAVERELGRRFHQLAGQARHVFEACDRDESLVAQIKANAAAEEAAGEKPAPADPWGSPSFDPWAVAPNKQSVMGMLNRLSVEQTAGEACFNCGDGFSAEARGEAAFTVNGYRMRVHRDPETCTRVLAARLDKEVPF